MLKRRVPCLLLCTSVKNNSVDPPFLDNRRSHMSGPCDDLDVTYPLGEFYFLIHRTSQLSRSDKISLLLSLSYTIDMFMECGS